MESGQVLTACFICKYGMKWVKLTDHLKGIPCVCIWRWNWNFHFLGHRFDCCESYALLLTPVRKLTI